MDGYLNFKTSEEWRDALKDARRKVKRYQEYLNKEVIAVADLRDRMIDIINDQVGEASTGRELWEKCKILYGRAGVVELNDEFNFLIRISLAECGNDYKKYERIFFF